MEENKLAKVGDKVCVVLGKFHGFGACGTIKEIEGDKALVLVNGHFFQTGIVPFSFDERPYTTAAYLPGFGLTPKGRCRRKPDYIEFIF